MIVLLAEKMQFWGYTMFWDTHTHTSIYFHTTIYVYKYGPLHTSYKYLATPFIMVYL